MEIKLENTTCSKTTEQKVEAIYKEIADKCDEERCCWNCDWRWYDEETVLIWDVLDYIDEKDLELINLEELTLRKGKNTHFTYTPITSYLNSYWKYMRKPIEEQSEETIDYIYNLLPNY